MKIRIVNLGAFIVILFSLTLSIAKASISLSVESEVKDNKLNQIIHVINTSFTDTLLIPISDWHYSSPDVYDIINNNSHNNYGGFNIFALSIDKNIYGEPEPIDKFCKLGDYFPTFVKIPPGDTLNLHVSSTLSKKTIKQSKRKLHLLMKINYVFLKHFRRNREINDYLQNNPSLLIDKKDFIFDTSKMEHVLDAMVNYRSNNTENKITDEFKETLCIYLQNYKVQNMLIKY